MMFAVDRCPDMHLVGAAAGSIVLPLQRQAGDKMIDNISDWGLDQFRKNYESDGGRKKSPITKGAIFHYVYSVLHDPAYREKYGLDLKRGRSHGFLSIQTFGNGLTGVRH